MKYAAFFRNTNLGRAGSPTRAQFEHAFLAAGATAASSFQVNGTMVFEATSTTAAKRILRSASATLESVAGLREPGCVRSLPSLNRIPWEIVFSGIDTAEVHEFTVSFACAKVTACPLLPHASERQDAVVLWLEKDDALSITRKVMSGPGSPNMLLERVTGVPFTSRSLGTIQRLLTKHA